MAESQENIFKLSEAFVLYQHTIQIANESIRHQKTRGVSDVRGTKQVSNGIKSMNVNFCLLFNGDWCVFLKIHY